MLQQIIRRLVPVSATVLIMFFFVSPVRSAPSGTTLIPADNPNINYSGRFDTATPAQPRVSWSGAIIEASFPGPIIGMEMQHQNAYYDIEIDGVIDTLISCGSNNEFIFRDDLSEEIHTVRIMLRSEDHYVPGTFSGLYLAEGKELTDPPPTPLRKIEFIGDSYTAGYGIESTNRSCSGDELKKRTNANKTFAALVTRAFHAQSVILGWSGAGMVRNYGEGSKRSESPFPKYYDKTLGGVVPGPTWDYSTYVPDLVVINLGTNDYSTQPHPDDSMYIGDYHSFITRILENYPEASILCVSTGDATFERNVKRIVEEEQTTFGHSNVYYSPYPSSLNLNGCDWHPDIADNRKVADVLIDTIMKKLEWDTAATSSITAVAAATPKRAKTILSAEIHSSNILITATTPLSAGTDLYLLDLHGAVISRNTVSTDHTCTFNGSRLQPGLYFAGNKQYGWIQFPVAK